MAYKALTGKPLPKHLTPASGFFTDVANSLINFGKQDNALFLPDSDAKDISKEAQDFINWIMKPNPADRPSMKEILNHPFLTNSNDHNEAAAEVWLMENPN